VHAPSHPGARRAPLRLCCWRVQRRGCASGRIAGRGGGTAASPPALAPSLARALCDRPAPNAPTSSLVRLPCAQCRGDGGVLMPPGPVGPCGALPGVVPSDWGPHSSPRNLFLNSALFLTHPLARTSARPRPALRAPWTTPRTREIRARARATPAPRQTGSSRNFVSFLDLLERDGDLSDSHTPFLRQPAFPEVRW
jgi:hypothetical protein